jgi:hypothetical protein
LSFPSKFPEINWILPFSQPQQQHLHHLHYSAPSFFKSHRAKTKMSNPVVFFDVAIGGRPAGRIEMTLRADVCPRTAENFR